MLYQEIPAGPQLDPFIHCFWILELDSPEPFVERVLPDGRAEIVIHYQNSFEQYSLHLRKWGVQKRSLFVGQSSESVLLRPGIRSGVIGVRFHPGGASQFLRMPMTELNGRIVELSDLFSSSAKELEDRVTLARNSRMRVQIVKKFLQDRLLDRSPDPIVSTAIHTILGSQGQIRSSDITRATDVGQRTLERHFRDAVGLTPKHFARIVRFQALIKAFQSQPKTNLTEIAIQFGYFDQSHFIREFKEFAGLSPANYLSQAHNLSDQFTAN